MLLLPFLSSGEVWNRFYEYKTSLACQGRFTGELRKYIDERRFDDVVKRIEAGEPFPLPKKSVLTKLGSEKKRTVYTYPYDENMCLKLLTYLLTRRYDGVFARNLYSFRPGVTAKDAVRSLLRIPGIDGMYSYKVDVHNYFNSVPVERFLPVLREKIEPDDAPLYAFLESLLTEPYVKSGAGTVSEQKGIMAGTPLSAFYANLYLADLDHFFEQTGALYARYSDDIIVFAKTREELGAYENTIKESLAAHGLTVNPDKEFRAEPGDGFTFLGFSYKNGTVDIAPATVKKLKQKMRRKRDALARWRKRNDVEPERAAKAFIRAFNRKLLEAPSDNELSWSRWFFPVISTDASLHEIDLYSQDCVRYLLTGSHTKSRFNARYEDLKALGYRNLVHEFHEGK